VIDVDSDLERMQDYVGGRLSEQEHRAFEERLLRDPALVREFEQSLRLRDGLEQLRTQGYFDEHAPRPRALRAWLPALAAAAAVAVVALFVWVQRASLPAGILQASLAGNRAAAPIAQFTFVSMRGGTAQELTLPPSGVVEFRATPPLHDAGTHYRMSLLRQDVAGARTLGSLTELTQGAGGYVHGFANAANLTPGLYTLRLEADAPRGSAATFPFSFRALRTP
jgi:hypothetical protein